MKYLVFDTEAEAVQAESQISADKGYPYYGENALTHEVIDGVGKTERWAIPKQVANGKWVFQSPDDSGVEWNNEDWDFPESEE